MTTTKEKDKDHPEGGDGATEKTRRDVTLEDVYAIQLVQSQRISSLQHRVDQTRVLGVVMAYWLCILLLVIVGAAIAKHEREAHFHAHCART